MDEALLRTLTPPVIGILCRRGADFAAAEDAVQEALIEAVRVWPDDTPRDPEGWLVTVAWRKFLDAARADTSRRLREGTGRGRTGARPGRRGGRHARSSTSCAHTRRCRRRRPSRSTLRARRRPDHAPDRPGLPGAGGDHGPAHQQGQADSSRRPLQQPGDVATVLRVLYLVFNEGYSGDVDLAAEAIRLTRQLQARTDDEEVSGLLALMLLHHARRSARTGPEGRLVALADTGPLPWDTRLIAEGVDVLQAAPRPRPPRRVPGPGRHRRAHADPGRPRRPIWRRSSSGTTKLVRLTDNPVARLNRSVAVGEADGAQAGLAALAALDPALPRSAAVAAYLHERNGDPVTAAPALRRGRPVGAQPARTGAPDAAGRPTHARLAR